MNSIYQLNQKQKDRGFEVYIAWLSIFEKKMGACEDIEKITQLMSLGRSLIFRGLRFLANKAGKEFAYEAMKDLFNDLATEFNENIKDKK